MESHYGGSRKAAQQLGLVPSTFNRLLNGAVKTSMTQSTYARLRDALSGHAIEFGLIDRFEGAVETGDFGFYDHRYQEWLDEELERLSGIARPVLLELWGRTSYKRVIERHLLKATRRKELPPPEQKRHWLALYRALEPLTKGSATWGVERSWSELHASGQLRGYLRGALSSELIMLDREGDFERMTKRPVPDRFLAELAGPFKDGPEGSQSDQMRKEILEELERADRGDSS